MPRSVHFDHTHPGEQQLWRELVREAMHVTGLDMYYLPRRQPNADRVYGEDPTQYFDSAYLTVFYMENVEGFEGEGSMLSHLGGLMIRDRITITTTVEDFADDVLAHETGFVRPLEGHLVYFPYADKLFQIRHVENRPEYYPHGILVHYRMELELFEYSSERFYTGITEIDQVFLGRTTDAHYRSLTTEYFYSLLTEAGDVLVPEDYALPDLGDDSQVISDEADEILVWDETDPFEAT